MPSVVMVHPYRDPGERRPREPSARAKSWASFDAEIVIFFISGIILATALRTDIGGVHALALVALIASGRQLVRAARGDRKSL